MAAHDSIPDSLSGESKPLPLSQSALQCIAIGLNVGVTIITQELIEYTQISRDFPT